MRRAQILLSSILLAAFITFPLYAAGYSTVDIKFPQTSKANSAARKGNIIDLKRIEPLKEAFQRDKDKVRLLALLSPT